MVFLQGAARETCPSGICLQLADSGVIDLFVMSFEGWQFKLNLDDKSEEL